MIFLLALGAGAIVLQIFLSKKEGRWPGLILPIITLCISLVAVFGIAAYQTLGAATMQAVTQQTVTQDGAVMQETSPEPSGTAQTMPTPSLIFVVVSTFLIYNIPTAILLAIYFACREKQRRRKALAKMQVQDLG
ncbi:MAG: hypothetical protein FWG53_02780 [Clostridiales bacterium]|nr:hypothetical protein [Clostridiales bacterium]